MMIRNAQVTWQPISHQSEKVMDQQCFHFRLCGISDSVSEAVSSVHQDVSQSKKNMSEYERVQLQFCLCPTKTEQLFLDIIV